MTVHRISSYDLVMMDALMSTFGAAFDDMPTHRRKRPSAAYLRQLLDSDYFIALAAVKDSEVVGGIDIAVGRRGERKDEG